MIKNEIKSLAYYLPLAFFILMALYFLTMPTTVVMEDDGFFIMSAWFNGVSHPPGYPVHSVLSHWATLIPIGTIPARVHAVSALFGALAAMVLGLIVYHLTANRIIALLSILILGTSRVFWSQSIVAEIYTLNVFIYLLLVYLALHIRVTRDDLFRRKLFYYSAFIYGLGISNHWPLIILGSSTLFILYAFYWKEILANFFKLLFFMLLGLLPYVWMVYRSTQDPVFNFSGELTSFSDFWFTFSRKIYADVDSSVSAGLSDQLHFALWFSRYSLEQFFFLLSPFIIIGFILQWKKLPRQISLAILAGVITTSFVLIALLNFDYDQSNQSVYRVYFLPTYALLVIWMAIGIVETVTWLLKKGVNDKFIYLAFSIFICLQVAVFLKENDRHDDFFAKEYANLVFSILPENAILIANDDLGVGVFGYFHFVEKQRPDIKLINPNGVAFNNRLFHPIHIERKEQEAILSQVFFQSGLPVFSLGGLLVGVEKKNYGFIFEVQVDKNNLIDNYDVEKVLGHLMELLKYNKRTLYFEKQVMDRLMLNFFEWAIEQYQSEDLSEELEIQLTNFIKYLSNNPRVLLRMLNYKIGTPDYEKNNWFSDSMDKVEQQFEVLVKNEKILFYILKAQYHQLKGIDDGEIWLEKADALTYDKNNEAAKILSELKKNNRNSKVY